MRVIHFTEGACDPLWGAKQPGVGFAPLLEGEGPTQIGCLHLSSGAAFDKAALENACALLIIQGKVVLREPCWLRLGGGVGIVMERGERFRLESEQRAVVLLVESRGLEATEIAISTPERIAGQRWGDEV